MEWGGKKEEKACGEKERGNSREEGSKKAFTCSFRKSLASGQKGAGRYEEAPLESFSQSRIVKECLFPHILERCG